ncbi:unnamed protein product [Calypogeia fissa]
MASRSVMKSIFLCAVMLCFVAAARAQTASDWLTPHNTAREALNVGELDLVWDSALEFYATNWAQHQATSDNCNVTISAGPFGENIHWDNSATLPSDAVQSWVNQQQWYNYATNACAAGEICLDYTQIVWKTTVALGCGQVSCPGGGTFAVCSYYPPGNVVGQSPY